MVAPVSIYFHIPFCTKKCDYCHFFVLPNKQPLHHQLLKGLSLDIDLHKPLLADKQLFSVYFGGGTPALLGAESLKYLLDKLNEAIPVNPQNIEITLEANPETITLQLMQDYAQAGINRVSIGIQSLDDRLLHKLGRTHHASTALNAIEITSKVGINNISIDLMYDIPGQTFSSWQHTLQQIENLPVTHLSLYNLTIEPHTVFFKYREALRKELPDAESTTQMYQEAVKTFNECGLKQYEISAFARNDMYSRHNVGYWTGRPFLGFGPSAFSYWEGRRFRAVANLNRYVETLEEGKSPIDFSEELPPEEHRREILAIALRLCQGVDIVEFEKTNGHLNNHTKKSLDKLLKEEFLKKEENIISLTEKGILFYDTVAVEII